MFKQFKIILKEIFNDSEEVIVELVPLLFSIYLIGILIGLISRLLYPSYKYLDRYYFKEEYSYQGFYNLKDRMNPLFNLKLCIMDDLEYETYKLIYNSKLGLKKFKKMS